MLVYRRFLRRALRVGGMIKIRFLKSETYYDRLCRLNFESRCRRPRVDEKLVWGFQAYRNPSADCLFSGRSIRIEKNAICRIFFFFDCRSVLVRIKISIKHVTARAYGNTRSRWSIGAEYLHDMRTWQRHDFTLETVFLLQPDAENATCKSLVDANRWAVKPMCIIYYCAVHVRGW